MMRKYTAALFAAAVLSAATMPASFAETHVRVATGNDSEISAGDVDTSIGVTLEVRKKGVNPFDDPVVGEKPDGGIKGITFTLYRAEGFDVTTPQGRAEASRSRTQEEFDALEVTKVASRVTGRSGEVVFEGLEPGLYRLEETAPDDEHEYRVFDPRWIVLPLGNVYGDDFEYESVVVVKPAQATTEPSSSTPTTTKPPSSTPTTAELTSTTSPPVPPSTTPSGTPGTPGETPTPTTDVPDKTSRPTLASTGANVLFALALGIFLVGFGFWLSRRSSRDE